MAVGSFRRDKKDLKPSAPRPIFHLSREKLGRFYLGGATRRDKENNETDELDNKEGIGCTADHDDGLADRIGASHKRDHYILYNDAGWYSLYLRHHLH
jgi:hypothetical protein